MAKRYALAIIGSGPGGYVAAIRAAQLGLKTVCIDKAELGGTCLNVGCIPSKSLLQSTELYTHILHHTAEHGIQATEVTYQFPQMMKRKEGVVTSLVNGIKTLFKHHQIDFIQGEAHFIDPHQLEIIQVNQKQTIEADQIILATGSEPIPLASLPFDGRQILSSTEVLSLTKVPERMVVIGGGVIGVELASVYSRLGTEVTVVEMLDGICLAMDESIRQGLLQVLKKQGIRFLLSTEVISAVVQPNEVILTINQKDHLENLSAEIVLVAIGRRPYSQGLDLEKIGVQVNPKGFIPVDDNFCTNHPHIYAIGDLIEGPMLAHRASEEGVVVVETLAGQAASINYMTIPNVIYTDPEAAAIGLTESEARLSGLDIKIGTSSFKVNPRARCMGDPEGFVKIIAESQTGRVIGLHILGAHASDLIEEGMIAIRKEATLHDLAYAPHAHPTLSETIKEAALNALGHAINK